MTHTTYLDLEDLRALEFMTVRGRKAQRVHSFLGGRVWGLGLGAATGKPLLNAIVPTFSGSACSRSSHCSVPTIRTPLRAAKQQPGPGRRASRCSPGYPCNPQDVGRSPQSSAQLSSPWQPGILDCTAFGCSPLHEQSLVGIMAPPIIQPTKDC